MGSSWSRSQTCVPCIGRRILNHCAAREALFLVFLIITILKGVRCYHIVVLICFSDDYWCWAPFPVPAGHLYVFFGNIFIQIFCPFLIIFFCCCRIIWILYILWIYLFLTSYMICKYFLPFHRLPFHFVDGFLCCAEAFLVWCSLTCWFLLLLPLVLLSNPKSHR